MEEDCSCAVSCPLLACVAAAEAAAVVRGEVVHSLATLSSVSMVDLRHTRPVWAGSAVRMACEKNANEYQIFIRQGKPQQYLNLITILAGRKAGQHFF